MEKFLLRVELRYCSPKSEYHSEHNFEYTTIGGVNHDYIDVNDFINYE